MENKKLKNIFIDIFIFVFIALFCFSNIFLNSIGNLDEIWIIILQKIYVMD